MNTALNTIYDCLPPQARSFAATVWGAYLRSWRYGPETERLVDEAFERERWSAAQWQSWREERLAFVLDRAARRVPYYRAIWQARRRAGDRSSWERLENWPLLEKETLRGNPQAFVAGDCSMASLFHEQTSGTTGTPIHIWRTRRSLRARYALYEARHRRWYGVTRFDRWAILGGQPVISVRQQRPPFWVWNAALRQLYLSSHHLAPEFAPYYFDALACYGVRYLWGYPSSLHSLAYHALRQRLRFGGMKVVITNAESLNETQRQTISAAFGCPVRETYGMVEFVAAAGECEHGALHEWPEVGVLETGEGGEFFCTGLQNPDMPLIRYRMGDCGSTPTWGHACPCGRPLPILQAIHGRVSDLVAAADGRRVFWLNPVFYGQPVREAQIVQLSSGQIQVRYVRDTGFTSATAQTIMRRLHESLGPMAVDLLPVDHIPRGANGKFRPVISHVPLPEQPSGQSVPVG
jgi:phenylacetate-CoA ligase